MKKWNIIVIIALMNLLSIPAVYATCPVCVTAVGTGVAVARFFGVDDTIVGVWVGAFVISTALWLDKILRKKSIGFKFQGSLLIILVLVLTVVSFYLAGIIGDMNYRIFGVDKMLLGILTGSFMTYFGIFVSNKIKSWRDKILFPFQTIIMILVFLILTSLTFWLFVG